MNSFVKIRNIETVSDSATKEPHFTHRRHEFPFRCRWQPDESDRPAASSSASETSPSRPYRHILTHPLSMLILHWAPRSSCLSRAIHITKRRVCLRLRLFWYLHVLARRTENKKERREGGAAKTAWGDLLLLEILIENVFLVLLPQHDTDTRK